jgi:hypothetical protein
MEYPKIHSYYKRDPETHKFIYEVAKKEFEAIRLWRCEEKIDGMNIRVFFKKIDERERIDIRGRTDDAMIPPKLLAYFKDKEKDLIEKSKEFPSNFILFGEGFGKGIQSGGYYRKDQAFILFDIYMNERWGTRSEVTHMANLLGFERPKEWAALVQIETIIALLKTKPKSDYSPDAPMEGVIARSEPLMRFNQGGDPIMFKLKVKDLL